MVTQKVGIVANDFKLNMFKKELEAKGFTDYTIEPFKNAISVIKVNVEDSKVKEVENICTKVEIHFKRGN